MVKPKENIVVNLNGISLELNPNDENDAKLISKLEAAQEAKVDKEFAAIRTDCHTQLKNFSTPWFAGLDDEHKASLIGEAFVIRFTANSCDVSMEQDKRVKVVQRLAKRERCEKCLGSGTKTKSTLIDGEDNA